MTSKEEDLIDFGAEVNVSKLMDDYDRTFVTLGEKIANLERNQNLLVQILEILTLEPVGTSSAYIMTPLEALETNEWVIIEQLRISLAALEIKVGRLCASVSILADSTEQGFKSIEQSLMNHI